MTEAISAVTTCHDTQLRRASVARFVRRAAISSVIATGALVAFAAPSWAAGSGPATDDSSQSAPATPDHSDRADTASGAGRSIVAGLTDGLHTLAGFHAPAQPATTIDDGTPADDTSDSASTGSSASGLSTTAPSATAPSATAPTTTTADATPVQHDATQTAPDPTAPPPSDGDSHSAPATPMRSTATHRQPDPSIAEPNSTAPSHLAPTTTSAPAVRPDATDSEDAADAVAPEGPSVLPVQTVTDTVASTLQAVPEGAKAIVDNTVTTVGSLTTPLDRVPGGLTHKLTANVLTPTLTTTSTVVDGVLTAVGDRVVDPTADTVRTIGVATQTGADATGDMIAALVPSLIGGSSRPGGSTQTGGPGTSTSDSGGPSESTSPTAPGASDGLDGTVVTPAGNEPEIATSETLDAPRIRGPRTPAYLPPMGRDIAHQGYPTSVGQTTSDIAPSKTTAGSVAPGDGSDQRVPVGHDQTPTDGGSSQGHSGSAQTGMDLVSSWLPGQARTAVPAADSWRLPGSLSYDPGHSPD